MDIEGVYIYSAFIAGLVSFLAPCTLPLLPAYLGFISGVTNEELEDRTKRKKAKRKILTNSLLFVLGFAIVLVSLGLLAGQAGEIVGPLRHYLTKIGGVIVILFGLMMVGVFQIQALARDRRIRMPTFLSVGRPSSSVLLGAIFALGWTPCIGPILATILFLASSTETALAGGVLLAVFAAGLGVPFILFALLITEVSWFVDRATPYLRVISQIGGVFLILLGLALVWGELSFLTSWIYGTLDWLNYEDLLLQYL
jgi:cytochrome c-type biogenesis protein